ncbi:MAG: hypothetical protein ACYTGQ_12540, partial [Planctomycetota bacterium]
MKYDEFIFAENGKRRFNLSEDSLTIQGKGLDATFLLKELEPEYDTVKQWPGAFTIGIVGVLLGI